MRYDVSQTHLQRRVGVPGGHWSGSGPRTDRPPHPPGSSVKSSALVVVGKEKEIFISR
jgi:hypothetical protein